MVQRLYVIHGTEVIDHTWYRGYRSYMVKGL